MSYVQEFREWRQEFESDYDVKPTPFQAYEAAKESSCKELEAAKQRIAELEEQVLARGYGWSECKAEKEALEKKLAEAQSKIMRYEMSHGTEPYVEGFEELTKLLTAAEQKGYDRAMKEVSEIEPSGWLVSGPFEYQTFPMLSSAEAYCKGLNAGYRENQYSILELIPRPSAPKGKE